MIAASDRVSVAPLGAGGGYTGRGEEVEVPTLVGMVPCSRYYIARYGTSVACYLNWSVWYFGPGMTLVGMVPWSGYYLGRYDT